MPAEKKLSICMLSDDFVPAATGVGTHLQSVSEHLAAAGHRVTVITTRRPGQPPREVWQGVDVHRVFTLPMFGFYQALPSTTTLEAIFDLVQPDILHHHYLGVMLLRAMKVARRRRLPQVYTYHMTEDHLTQPVPMRPFRRWIGAQIVKCCNEMDVIVSVSKNLAVQLPAKGITSPVHYISNPVRFQTSTAIEPAPRDAGFVVMFAGRLDPEKNLPFLLRSFARMRAAVPDASLWIAGSGTQRSRLERLARELNIERHVQFFGFLGHEELCRRYMACDVFVLPSLVETQGLVAMEAMWFGKPLIVARSVVSASELVEEGINGYIVDNDSEDALIERLTAIARDTPARDRMGRASQTRAQAYQPANIVAALESLYATI
ncbi:MAG: glycosyltransferase [Rubrivivax sp.]|nr:glycosyltransferase [Rubrivivax sp.]